MAKPSKIDSYKEYQTHIAAILDNLDNLGYNYTHNLKNDVLVVILNTVPHRDDVDGLTEAVTTVTLPKGLKVIISAHVVTLVASDGN